MGGFGQPPHAEASFREAEEVKAQHWMQRAMPRLHPKVCVSSKAVAPPTKGTELPLASKRCRLGAGQSGSAEGRVLEAPAAAGAPEKTMAAGTSEARA